MPDLTTLTSLQLQVMHGLSFGHVHLSAFERGSPEIMEIANLGYVEMWMTQGGFPAWRLSGAGRAALVSREQDNG